MLYFNADTREFYEFVTIKNGRVYLTKDLNFYSINQDIFSEWYEDWDKLSDNYKELYEWRYYTNIDTNETFELVKIRRVDVVIKRSGKYFVVTNNCFMKWYRANLSYGARQAS